MSTLPQTSSFQASRDDVLNMLGFFFGEPQSPEKLNDYSEHHAMTFHFPDAYLGQNNRIRDTLNNLVLRSPQEWQTSVGLPFVQITGTTVEWDELRFDVRLLQRVPYEGVSRMQTSLRRRHRDRVVRRGIGMVIESDFYSTEAGRSHFQDQLTSIRYCVQETCNFDALFAYLTCGNYDFRYDMAKGLRPRRSLRTAMAHEIAMYAIVQKEGLGLDKAVEVAKDRMSRYQITPNMLVVPPALLLYMALAPDEKIKFSEGGERAVANFDAGKAGYEARAFRGLGVFTSSPFEVSDDSDSVQMLQRSTQVGEFYRMSPPPVYDENKPLPATYMDILVYNEEADKLQHITFAEALHACCLDDVGGKDDVGKVGVFKLNDDDVQKSKDHAKKIEVLFKNEEGEKNPITIETMLNTQKGIVAAVKAGVWVPVCITIARPFIEHLMVSSIATVSGRDTGATLFGPADMQISANTSVKTIEGHYTCHTKSVITKPQNVFVMRDIMCTGYVAGGNTTWLGWEEKGVPTVGDGVTAENVRQAISRRLAMADDVDGNYGSMLAFACPLSETQTSARDQVISISERMLPWEVRADATGTKKGFPGAENGFIAYVEKYGLRTIHYGEDRSSSENQEFLSNGSINNSMCILGPHRKYNPFSQNYYELVPGQGHFGPDAIPGDARWRRGEAVSLKSARDAMVSLEVAAHSQLALRPATA